MLTQKDIKNLTEYQKEVFVTKTEFSHAVKDLKNSFSQLQTSVDSFAKRADAYYQEMAVLMHKVERMEKWIKEASVKLGVSYNT